MEVSNNTVTSELLLKMAFRVPANVPGSELSQETHMKFNDYFTEDAMFLDPVPETLQRNANDKETTPPSEYGLYGGLDIDYDGYERYPSQHVERFSRLVLENVRRSDTGLYRLTTSYTRYDASGNSLLRNTLQFNYGDGSSYDYFLFIDGELIEKGDRQRNWYFDVRSGYITFYGSAPVAGQTIELTFVRYIGKKSIRAFRSEIDATYQEFNGKFETLKEDISGTLGVFEGRIDTIDASFQAVNTKIDTDISALSHRVDASLASLNTSVEQLIDDVSNSINTSIDELRVDVSAIQTEKTSTFVVNHVDVSGDIDFKGKLYNNGVEFLNYNALDNCGNDLLVKGNLIPDTPDAYNLGTLEHPFRDLYLGPQSLYINGVPVIQDRDVGGTQREMVFATTNDQNLVLQTAGSGSLQLKSTGSGALTMVSTGADVTLESNGGDVNVKSTTGGVRFDALNGEIALNSSSNIQLNPDVLNGYSVRVNAPLIMGNGQVIKGSSEPLTVEGELLTKGRTTISGEMIVQGNFTVTGNTSYLDTNVTRIRQDVITVNGGNATLSSGTLAGIKINRGEGVTPYFFAFEEGSQSFKIGEEGDVQPVMTREDNPVDNGIPYWDSTEYRVKTTSDMTYNGSTVLVHSLDASSGHVGVLSASSGSVSGSLGVGSLDASSGHVGVLSASSGSVSGSLGVGSLDASSGHVGVLSASSGSVSGSLGVGSLDASGSVTIQSGNLELSTDENGNNGNILVKYGDKTLSAIHTIPSKISPASVVLAGEAGYNYFGWSVDLSEDGTVLAVGTGYNSDNGSNSGHVRVYQWNGESWVRKGADIDGENAEDQFGNAVALSADGNILAVGATENNGGGLNRGRVNVYQWNGTSWIQQGTAIDGENDADRFGTSVALSADGTILASGSKFNNGSGHVRVFSWNGYSWIQRGVSMEGESISDRFGASVSLSADGNIVASGAVYNDGNGFRSGHVQVYYWNGSAWEQRGTDIDGENSEDEFGTSVALSADGSILAVGAPKNDGNGSNSGHVRVYHWNGSAWVQQGTDIDGEETRDRFGYSVALSADGNLLAVGAPDNDGNGFFSGHVRIYHWNGSAWVQRDEDIDGGDTNHQLGSSVALSADGNIVVSGAPNGSGNGTLSGQVHVHVHKQISEVDVLLGVGTISPTYKLDVSGEMNATSLYENGTALNVKYLQSIPSEYLTESEGDAKYSLASHTHTTTDITNLSSYTGLDVRYYTESEVDGFLSGKANTSHTHTTADITNLSSYTGLDVRYYTESEVDGFLSGKANTSHTHTTADITDLSGYTGFDSKFVSVNGDTITGTLQVDGSMNATLGSFDGLIIHNDLIVNGQIYSSGIVNQPGALPSAFLTESAGDEKYALSTHTHTTTDITNLSSYTGLDVRYYTKDQVDGMFANHTSSGGTGATTTADITDLNVYTGFDSRYYTESEVDGFLSGKANTSHTHTTADITDLSSYTGFDSRYVSVNGDTITGTLQVDGSMNATLGSFDGLIIHNDLIVNGQIYSSGIVNQPGVLPSAFLTESAGDEKYALSTHTHTTTDITNLSSYTGLDVRYYTKDQVDGMLANHTSSGGTGATTTADITDLNVYTGFDSRYYTESEVDGFLSGKANTSHTHTTANITNLSSYTGFDSRYALKNDISTVQSGLNSKLESNDVNSFCIAGNSIQTSDLPDEVMLYNEVVQTNRTASIYGEHTGDKFGSSVAISQDERTIAIGSEMYSQTSLNRGSVHVYQWNGTNWIQKGTAIEGTDGGDRFGQAVALSADGNILAASCEFNGPSRGYIRVFVWNGSAWVQRGTNINGENTADRFGLSLSLSADGSIVASGSFLNDDNGTDSGNMRVFAWNGSAWVQRGATIGGQAGGDMFGISVALSGDGNTLAGASRGNKFGSRTGYVNIYYWNGSAWVQKGTTLTGSVSTDQFGSSMSFSYDGAIICIGSEYSPTSQFVSSGTGDLNSFTGNVKVYQWSDAGSGQWVQRGTTIYGKNTGDRFGASVSLSLYGDVFIAGAPYHDGNGSESGHVRMFVFNGTDWVERDINVYGESTGDRIGTTVSLSADGSTFIAGADINDTNGTDSGMVRIFSIKGTVIDASSGIFDSINVKYDARVDGYIYTTAVLQHSDTRIKRNIVDVSASQLVDRFRLLKPVEYSFASYANGHRKHEKTIGFIAQDVEKVFPEYVSRQNKSYALSSNPEELQQQLVELSAYQGIDIVEENGQKKAIVRDMRNIDKTQLYETMVPVLQHVLNQLDTWNEEKQDILARLARLENK